jgi:hypothetical protein
MTVHSCVLSQGPPTGPVLPSASAAAWLKVRRPWWHARLGQLCPGIGGFSQPAIKGHGKIILVSAVLLGDNSLVPPWMTFLSSVLLVCRGWLTTISISCSCRHSTMVTQHRLVLPIGSYRAAAAPAACHLAQIHCQERTIEGSHRSDNRLYYRL